MKKIFVSTALILIAGLGKAQTTATDFTAIDCLGGSHNLFTELNNGKVMVLVWVMPCSGCVNGAKAADSARQSLAASIPAGVFLYLICSGPPNDCTTLQSWSSANHLGHPTLFGNTNHEIDENNYGGFGMPHIVVVGPDHAIYFNQKDSTGAGVYDAVQNAINVATNVKSISNSLGFTVSPNPGSNALSIQYTKLIKSVTISSLNGAVVNDAVFSTGILNPRITISGMVSGIYLVKVVDEDGNTGIQKFIKN